jgi:hypothetical protein
MRIVDREQRDRAQQAGRPALFDGETKKSNRRREPRVRRCARGRHSRTGRRARAGTKIEDCHARGLGDSWREIGSSGSAQPRDRPRPEPGEFPTERNALCEKWRTKISAFKREQEMRTSRRSNENFQKIWLATVQN